MGSAITPNTHTESNGSTMPRRQFPLFVVPATETRQRPTVSAPPFLDASSHTTDYVCGHCGTILMHAEEGQIHKLLIHCLACGSYNSTEA